MTLTPSEQRALEIYIFLILNKIRHNNSSALSDIKNFFYSLTFTKKYDAELLYHTCITHLEILDTIPTHQEILLTAQLDTPNLKFNFKIFKPYYKRTINRYQYRALTFSQDRIRLQPKIKVSGFHNNLLTFLKQFVIIAKTLPNTRS